MADFLILFFFCFYLVARPMVPSGNVGGGGAVFPGAGGLGTDALLQAFVVTAALLWFLRSILEGGFEVALSGLEVPGLIFLGLAGLSAWQAADSFHAWVRTGYWLGDLCCFWLALQYGRTTIGARLLLRVVLATAVVVSVNGLYQHFWGLEQMRRAGLGMIQQIPKEMRDHFMIRLTSKRIFSTFVLANGLAGYLIVLLPLLLVQVVQCWNSRWRYSSTLLVCVAVGALLLSGSKGGILALSVALALGCLIRRREILAHRKAALAVALLVALGGSAFLLTVYKVGPFAKLRSRLGDTVPTRKVLGDTVRVRLGYWKASWKIARDHPLRGVGPDNFASYYQGYRDANAGQTQRAHNNYLQLAAEVGFPGLLAFLLFWVLLARRMLFGRGSEELVDPPPTRRSLGWGVHQAGWIYAAVCIAVFVLLRVLDESLDGPQGRDGKPLEGAAYLLASLVWLGVGPVLAPRMERLTLWALGVGLGAFLLHSIVDFDLYVIGISATVWTLAGLACAMLSIEWGLPVKRVCLPIWSRALLVLLCLPLFYLFSNEWLLRSYRAERHLAEAAEQLKERRGGLAIHELEQAILAVPWSYGSQYELGQLYMRSFTRAKDWKNVKAGWVSFERGRALLLRCTKLNRRHAGAYYELGQAHQHLATVYLRDATSLEQGSEIRVRLERIGRKSQADALEYYRTAITLYPVKPMYHYFLARALMAADKPEQARAAYRRSLQLHEQRGPRDSLRLPPNAVDLIKENLENR